MKRLYLTILFLSLCQTAFGIEKVNSVSVRVEVIDSIKTLKPMCKSDSAKYVRQRQLLEDILEDYSDDLDATDITKIQAGIVKIQNIIDEINALETALNNNFPAIK